MKTFVIIDTSERAMDCIVGSIHAEDEEQAIMKFCGDSVAERENFGDHDGPLMIKEIHPY